jgi:hypothetical protein
MRQPEPDSKLESLSRASLNILFDNGGQVVSNECLPGFGNSQIRIRVLDIEFRIIQSGGDLSAYAAPCNATNSWQSVESLLMAIDSEHNLPPPPVYGSLSELGSLLESRLVSLNNALSPERFASTIHAARQSKMKEMITLKPRVTAQPSTARQVVAAAVRGLAKATGFLTPKTKDNLAKFLPVDRDAEFEQQVTQEFDNVFRKFGAQINSNGRLRIMDFATVTFDLGNLRVRASRDRGFVHVSVAPIHAVREWHSLGAVLRSLQEDGGIAESSPSSILRGAGKLLYKDFVKLSEAFSEDEYPTARKRIREINESLRQKWLKEFNQKSKVFHAEIP